MRRRIRRVRRRLQPHGDSRCSTFRYLSLINFSLVILSEAKDLLSRGAGKSRSFASLRMTISCMVSPVPQPTLSLNRKQKRLLKRLRDPAQKTRGVGAVDQPVIVRE